MSEGFLRRNLTTVLVAMVTAAVTGGGSAVAATIADFARNSDKVDNIHAGPATTTSRANKLIATDANGKLPAAIIPTPTNADKVDGLHAVTSGSTSKAGKLVATDSKGQLPVSVIPKDATPFASYVVVRSDAGSAAANASRLQSKVTSLAATATKDKRYVVLLEPGQYAFGTGRLTMKPYVDVVGAGAGRTVLTGGGGASADAPTVLLAKDSALRQLTVKTLASTPAAAAYVGGAAFTDAGGETEVSDVSIDVGYQSPADAGVAYGVRNTGWKVTLRRVDISVYNAGVTNHGVFNTGFLTAEDTKAVANGGGHTYGLQTDGIASAWMTYSAVTLTDSSFAGHNGTFSWGIKSYNGYGTLVRTHLSGSIGLETHSGTGIAETFDIDGGTVRGTVSTVVAYADNTVKLWRGVQLDGPRHNAYAGSTGPVTCTGVYDENRTFYASSCPS